VSTLPEAQAAEVVSELWATGGLRTVGGRTAADVARRLAQRDGERESLSEGQRRWLERWTKIDGQPREALEAISDLAREAGAEMGAALQQASDRFARLQEAGVPADRQRLCAGFGRPFGYYDGFLFEVRSAALPTDEPVAAGGRYDGLLGRLQPGADAPAVGCMVRPYRAWSGAAA
jgi:ATP phosphoribosyltransferase regulatory subunit